MDKRDGPFYVGEWLDEPPPTEPYEPRPRTGGSGDVRVVTIHVTGDWLAQFLDPPRPVGRIGGRGQRAANRPDDG